MKVFMLSQRVRPPVTCMIYQSEVVVGMTVLAPIVNIDAQLAE